MTMWRKDYVWYLKVINTITLNFNIIHKEIDLFTDLCEPVQIKKGFVE